MDEDHEQRRENDVTETTKVEPDLSHRSDEDDGVDMTLVRWFGTLTPLQRLRVLEDHIAAVERLRGGTFRS